METEIRTDGPVPISIRYENGLRHCTYAQGELESYVQKHPDVLVEIRDRDGNFVRYMDTEIMRNLLIETGFLPSDKHLLQSRAALAD